MSFAIPSPLAPITADDGKTISPVWWRYLRDIQKLIGGASSPFEDTWFLGMPPVASEATTADPLTAPVQIASAPDNLTPPSYVAPYDDLLYPPRSGL